MLRITILVKSVSYSYIVNPRRKGQNKSIHKFLKVRFYPRLILVKSCLRNFAETASAKQSADCLETKFHCNAPLQQPFDPEPAINGIALRI